MYRNKEGYADSTAGRALEKVQRAERKREGDISDLIKMLKLIISLAGFELIGRIELKDKQTGKEYK